MTLVIDLRDLGSRPPLTMLLRVVYDDDRPRTDTPSRVITYELAESETDAFEKFASLLSKTPYNVRDTDIYISVWGQTSFEIPGSFFKIINCKKLKVTLSIDD